MLGTSKVSRIFQILSVLVAIGNVAGCKLDVLVPPTGEVTSATGSHNCAAGSLCEFNVTDRTFFESFTAVPKPGYKFVKWQAGPGFLCGDSSDATCTVDNTRANEAVAEATDDVIAGESAFYAMPLFEAVGNTSDANAGMESDGSPVVTDAALHPVGNSGRLARARVGDRQKLGEFGKAITRARYAADGNELQDGTRSMASIGVR